jgi:hypothetical protein
MSCLVSGCPLRPLCSAIAHSTFQHGQVAELDAIPGSRSRRSRGSSAGSPASRQPARRARSRSHLPPRRCCRIDQLNVDGTDTEDGDYRRGGLTLQHPVVMWGPRSTFHVSAWPNGSCVVRQEIVSTVDPPSAKDNDASPVGCICMGCAEPARIPPHHHQIWAGLVEIAVKHCHFATSRWQATPRFERHLLVRQDERFVWIGRSGVRGTHGTDIGAASSQSTSSDRCQQQRCDQQSASIQVNVAHGNAFQYTDSGLRNTE